MSRGAGLPRVVLVGRRNVGKSTLANRLVGRREAIADDEPGVTRDRLELPGEWRGRRFVLVDTGGFVPRARGIEALVAGQADRATEAADVVLLVVDAQAGVREEDALQARRLRRLRAPVVVVANKVDSEREEPDAWAFHALGLGEPIPVSALHGRGTGELLDRVVDLLPAQGVEPQVEGEPRFAIVGRPNVGKSSLFNRLAGEERSVVYEEAGTTRDAVDALVAWPGGPVRFVDTAGFRRPSRARGVEYYGYVRSLRAIDRADVALLVLDAGEGFTAEDRRIAGRVLEAGRGLVIVANKWDLARERDRLARRLAEEAAPFAHPRVLRASALRGTGIHRLPAALLETHAAWRRRVATSEVNRVLERAVGERPPPRGARYRYATQVSAGPPSFVVFDGPAPPPAYQRFLEQRLREAFGLAGVPVRLVFRARRRSRRGGVPRAHPPGGRRGA